MVFMQRYASPLGGLLLAADEQGLIGLWFEGARHFAANLPEAREEKRTPILDEAARWLDDYFSGGQPDFTRSVRRSGCACGRACLKSHTGRRRHTARCWATARARGLSAARSGETRFPSSCRAIG